MDEAEEEVDLRPDDDDELWFRWTDLILEGDGGEVLGADDGLGCLDLREGGMEMSE